MLSCTLLLIIPRHDTPSFSKKLSSLHWHWNDPFKFKHWSSQPPLANKHSSISVNEICIFKSMRHDTILLPLFQRSKNYYMIILFYLYRAVVVMIVQINLQLPMQPMSIITNFVSSKDFFGGKLGTEYGNFATNLFRSGRLQNHSNIYKSNILGNQHICHH